MLQINRRRVGSRAASTLLAVLCAGLMGSAVANGAPAGRPGTMLGAVTSQDNPALFQLTANRSRVARIRITLVDKCQSGMPVVINAGTDSSLQISRTGVVSASYTGSPTGLADGSTSTFSDQLNGKFNKARTQITGTWHNTQTIKAANGTSDTCDSGTVSFTATD